MAQHYDVAIIGAGVIGLAHALAAAKQGSKVIVFEKNSRAVGASIRNFGMVWPIGQTEEYLPLAKRSRQIWKELAKGAGFWLGRNSSLHLAVNALEATVMQEFTEKGPALGYEVKYIPQQDLKNYSPNGLRHAELHGALWSATETTVNPVEAIRAIPAYLQQQFGVDFSFEDYLLSITGNHLKAHSGSYTADRIVICQGQEYDNLFGPEIKARNAIRCKLQMMRIAVPNSSFQLTEALASGFSMVHYPAFQVCDSLPQLAAYYQHEYAHMKKWGIHILMTQNNHGEIIIGDTHEYDNTLDPFDRMEMNQVVLDWVKRYLQIDEPQITASWNGTYLKNLDAPFFRLAPEPHVRVVNGFGGVGMTLSFGVGEQTFEQW